jgi:hypothetical protein
VAWKDLKTGAGKTWSEVKAAYHDARRDVEIQMSGPLNASIKWNVV